MLHLLTSSRTSGAAGEDARTSSRSVINVAGRVGIGGRSLAIIAGPCSVEGRDMLLDSARAVRDAGAVMLRGGAFKPRTSPYAFRGLGEEALEILAEAREATGLPVVTEILDPRHLERMESAADVLQVGARNMQNFALLSEVGLSRKPVLLKRGLSATLDELLLAAEYILAAGNPNVILCERGIRTYETATRNTLDVAAVPVLKSLTHLPVIVDPSHAGGRADLVEPLALAAVAAGADGLIVEVHPRPTEALSDGDQSLTPELFARLVERCDAVAHALGRRVLTANDAGVNVDVKPRAQLSGKRATKARVKQGAKTPAKTGAGTAGAAHREERWPA
ncbi:MAG TPA: 3-deoxy-7-phosphoheptulonate synthase [Gemmatimonadaceae bacterium]|nr:3-deoxy-7-phosphoheptulonate synthase [Gemmatimonadaceae bacterium]